MIKYLRQSARHKSHAYPSWRKYKRKTIRGQSPGAFSQTCDHTEALECPLFRSKTRFLGSIASSKATFQCLAVPRVMVTGNVCNQPLHTQWGLNWSVDPLEKSPLSEALRWQQGVCYNSLTLCWRVLIHMSAIRPERPTQPPALLFLHQFLLIFFVHLNFWPEVTWWHWSYWAIIVPLSFVLRFSFP